MVAAAQVLWVCEAAKKQLETEGKLGPAPPAAAELQPQPEAAESAAATPAAASAPTQSPKPEPASAPAPASEPAAARLTTAVATSSTSDVARLERQMGAQMEAMETRLMDQQKLILKQLGGQPPKDASKSSTCNVM